MVEANQFESLDSGVRLGVETPLASGKKTVQLATPDYKKLVLIGADAFSCDWKDVRVAVNYRGSSSSTTGDLVSLELQ